MKNRKKLKQSMPFLLILTALVSACTVQDGLNDYNSEEYGALRITAEGSLAADIFVNGWLHPEKTPAQIDSLPAGEYEITLLYPHRLCDQGRLELAIGAGSITDLSFSFSQKTGGNLSVLSDPAGARVILDDLVLGVTPFHYDGFPIGAYLLEIQKGSHRSNSQFIEIRENERFSGSFTLSPRKTLLVEHFSNTNCPPCPQAEAIIENLVGEFTKDEVISIGYHASFPSNADPMYRFAQAANDARAEFYKLAAAPAVYLNGKFLMLTSFPQLEEDLRNAILESAQEIPQVLLHIEMTKLRGLEIECRLHIECIENLPNGANLYYAVTEDTIRYETAPGTNGQTHFADVMRAMHSVPASTIEMNGLHGTITQKLSLSAIPAGKLWLLVWLQAEDKSIIQSVKSPLSLF
ncbi:MAG TPA: PEGA domain-containing protein [Candidatus Marinimicrobia bacterium]|nr:PEGA domain-containing protein [Candidatus Neomarinimicrobiota bacterium]